jgi:hypothetical protein
MRHLMTIARALASSAGDRAGTEILPPVLTAARALFRQPSIDALVCPVLTDIAGVASRRGAEGRGELLGSCRRQRTRPFPLAPRTGQPPHRRSDSLLLGWYADSPLMGFEQGVGALFLGQEDRFRHYWDHVSVRVLPPSTSSFCLARTSLSLAL